VLLRVRQKARRGVHDLAKPFRAQTGAGSNESRRSRLTSAFVVALCVGIWSSLALMGCHINGVSDVSVEAELSPAPAMVGPATVVIRLREANGQPVRGAAVTVEGNMSHPGMSPVFAKVTAGDPGEYKADMEFTMAGDWILSVNAALPDGRTVEEQINVRGVKSQ
jgi:hypothetical protein